MLKLLGKFVTTPSGNIDGLRFLTVCVVGWFIGAGLALLSVAIAPHLQSFATWWNL